MSIHTDLALTPLKRKKKERFRVLHICITVLKELTAFEQVG